MSTSLPPGRRLVFTGKQQVRVEGFELTEPGPKEVRLNTELSLMSTGTENIVFNRAFDPGTHWDNWVKYPFHPGYASVGKVEAVGSEVASLRPGDRVVCRAGHRSAAVLPEADCLRAPDGLPSEEAVWFALAKIAFHGALAAKFFLGDSVLVVGVGPIGQMAVRWARAAGAANILVVDPVEQRMAAARSGGATAVINARIDQARDGVLAACDGDLPRVVIDSTGNAQVFAAALGLAASRGTVVILGDTGSPARQSLTVDVITRGLTIVGAHDGLNTPEWNNLTIGALFLRFASEGRFNLNGLTSHRFLPEQCEQAYRIANQERESTMGIIFDWQSAS